MDATELRRRLEPFGIGEEAAVLVFALEDPGEAAGALEAGARRRRLPGRRRPPRSRRPRAALRGGRRRRPRPDRGRDRGARRRSPASAAAVRAAASRPAPPESLRHSFHEARCALEATALRQRLGPRGRLLARPRRLHPAALDPGRRRARPLLRQRARPDRARATRSTAASCCARWRPSSSRTASGSGPPARSTATATRCATGCARSRS